MTLIPDLRDLVTTHPMVLVQCSPGQLIIAHAGLIQKIPLINHEITTSSIANPTRLHMIITDFCHQHDIQHAKMAVGIDLSVAPHRIPYLTLQAALTFGSLSLALTHLALGKILNPNTGAAILDQMAPEKNLLATLMSSDYQKTTILLRSFIHATAIIIIALSILYFNYHRSIKALHREMLQENAHIKELAPQSQLVQTLEKDNAILDTKLTRLNKLSNEQETPFGLLVSLAKNIPEHTWLTSIAVGTRPTDFAKKQPRHVLAATQAPEPGTSPLDADLDNHEKNVPIIIEGLTQHPDEVGDFLNQLGKELPGARIAMSSIKRLHSKGTTAQPAPDEERLYKFCIGGTVGRVITSKKTSA